MRTYWNIMLTFLVSGIWHGANWTFILWGLIHGFAQCVEKSLGLNKPVEKKWLVLPRIALTFTIVTFAWIFFRLPTIGGAWDVIKHIFSFGEPFIELITMVHILFAIVVVAAVDYLMEYKAVAIRSLISRYTVIRWGTYLFLTLSLLLFGVLNSGQFIYVSF